MKIPAVIISFGLLWSPDLAQASCVSPPPGLMAWWPGEGNANDVISGNNGTLTNGAGFSAGEVGQGFSFGTSGAGILLGNPTNLQSQDFTIEAWIRRGDTNVATTDPAAGGAAVIFGYGSQGYAFGMGVPPWTGWLWLEVAGGYRISAGPLISDVNLHHVAVTRAGTNVVFYVDGVGYPFPLSLFSVTFQFTTQAAIGVRSDRVNGAGNASFCGTIDEVSFYNRPLIADEIAATYAAGSAGKCRAGASANLTIDRQAGIAVEGTVGAAYFIQCVPDVNDTNWTTFTNFVLPQSPYRILAPDAPRWSSRFYRVQRGTN